MKCFEEWTDEGLQKLMKRSQVETIETSMYVNEVEGPAGANSCRSVTYMMLQGRKFFHNYKYFKWM